MALASELERGKFFEYRNEILQVVKKEIVAYGTHSHSKLKLTVSDLHGKSEKVITLGHNDRVDLLEIKKKTATIISKGHAGVQIMDPVSYETFDADIDSSLLSNVNEGEEIIYVEYKGKTVILDKKGQK